MAPSITLIELKDKLMIGKFLQNYYELEIGLSTDKKHLKIESWDCWLDESLTKAQVIELANDFLKLADEMVE